MGLQVKNAQAMKSTKRPRHFAALHQVPSRPLQGAKGQGALRIECSATSRSFTLVALQLTPSAGSARLQSSAPIGKKNARCRKDTGRQ
jgi:hypothetical protein